VGESCIWKEEFEDSKRVVRIRKYKKERQHNGQEKDKEEFEDTKGVINIRNRRRKHNAMTKRKRTKGKTTIYKTLRNSQNKKDKQ
jgi:hypothetical protein